ncbi:MAG: hypothetical protein A2Z42_01070 [Candidatus Woykebacteria bacterium RBG_19FT_COMBO_43_10]|uniref:Peptidase M50 domain-containing protein n=1 Tax=Candidatus Woykebacteria bacterium RBG_19FT_COMBO_43_10 TaxID=1802598 RepID=A0A1G1WKX4_9BACT|nr:MAG: hypothetical protein A2Z42_01070 [Candidatus Woykebacteria bacterium RBG_19FT_COMBO_43_10]
MIPEGYKKLDSWRSSNQLIYQHLIIMLLFGLTLFWFFLWVANLFQEKPVTDVDLLLGNNFPLLILIPFLVLNQIIVLIPHEAIHGIAAYFFGGRPRFGFILIGKILPGAYTTFDELLTRDKFIIVSLAPLFVLTILGVGLMFLIPPIGPFLAYPLALNAGGSIVDCWLVKQALRYPTHVLIKDEMHELVVFGKETDESKKTTSQLFFSKYLNLILIIITTLFILNFFFLSMILKFFHLE